MDFANEADIGSTGSGRRKGLLARNYIKNAHKFTALTLESIAKAGSGCVTFDFTD